MIPIRKDEVKYLTKIGMERYIIGKTCHGKKFVEESSKVLLALRKYNDSIVIMED